MGIPSYFSYIIKNYSNIIRSILFHRNNKTPFNSLYMDCNSIIYDTYYHLIKSASNIDDIDAFETILIDSVIEKIQCYVREIKPDNVLYITFDGVAPFAKMEQQRTRRYKSWYSSSMNFSETLALPSSTALSSWNTSSITPGTLFMNTLSRKIKGFFENKEKMFSLKQIIVSCSDIPGEGEHKIFQHIRDNLQPTDNILVYGLDSDLIMLSIFHVGLCNNIFVFREAPEFSKSKVIVKSESKELLFLDIHILCNSVLMEMGYTENEKHRIYDYIFLCFFLGNDFLPHFPCLNIRSSGIQVLMETYKKYIGSFVDRGFISPIDGKIQWKYVALFVSEIAKMEHTLLLSEYSLRDKMDFYKWGGNTIEEKEHALLNTPIIYRADEKYIYPKEKYWEDRYYKCLLQVEKKEESIKKVCVNYLEGLEWVFKYYTEGCPDWKWKYNYHYPPLFADLVKYIPKLGVDFINPSPEYNYPFSPELQLAYVIPPPLHYLLGEKNKTFLEKKYRDFYSESFEYKWAFCRYFWESHVVLPEISIEELHRMEAML